MAAAQMHASPQRRGQPEVSSHHKNEAPRTADPCQVPTERLTARFAVMTQHHTGEAARETRHRGAGIGQAACVGEQP